MILQDVLDALASSELANLSCVKDGEVLPTKIPQVVNAINLALTSLHTRFKLKRNYIDLSVTPSQRIYTLENILEILTIKNPNDCEVRFDGADVTLLEGNSIQFLQEPIEGTYKIEHLPLPNKVIYTNDTDVPVDLPLVYLNALLCFVASRFYSPVGVAMDSNRNSMDMNYIQRYEKECQLLESKGLDVDVNQDSSVWFQRGFI